MHGYASPEAYWDSNSCTPFLNSIRVPTLVVNARNDTFLGPACYPLELVSSLQSVSMEVPAEGGHIGFPLAGGACWMEERALRFIAEEA